MDNFVNAINLYYCKDCDDLTESPVVDRDCPSEFCPNCGNEVEHAGTRQAKWHSVAMYRTFRVYGGPEEGGWYYSAGELMPETVRSFEAGDLPQFLLYKSQLWNRAYAENDANRKYGGEERYEIRTYEEKLPDGHFPRTRPYYS